MSLTSKRKMNFLWISFFVLCADLLVSITSNPIGESETQVRAPDNADFDSKYIEMLLVVDHKAFTDFNGSVVRVHQFCKEVTAYVNSYYNQINVFVALSDVVIWKNGNLAQVSINSSITRENFRMYREQFLVEQFPHHDTAFLLSGETFSASAGSAYFKTMCSKEYSCGFGKIYSNGRPKIVASLLAHEIGLNLGMNRQEDTNCTCPDCIMGSPNQVYPANRFSSCSIDEMRKAFKQGTDVCLKNKPKTIFGGSFCGNGFVEPGEECDCGMPGYCASSCCNPITCKLQTFAACATGSCCDLTTCKTHTAGRMCRQAVGECDLPEYCAGDQEFCPNDVYKRDGEECKSGEAFCYQGSCQSHDDQCKVLWGPSASSSDRCYSNNVNGTIKGNCGYDQASKKYLPCKIEDNKCGTLQCDKSSDVKLNLGELEPFECQIFINTSSLSAHSSYSPNGAKCGERKMCVNQKCILIESFNAGGSFESDNSDLFIILLVSFIGIVLCCIAFACFIRFAPSKELSNGYKSIVAVESSCSSSSPSEDLSHEYKAIAAIESSSLPSPSEERSNGTKATTAAGNLSASSESLQSFEVTTIPKKNIQQAHLLLSSHKNLES